MNACRERVRPDPLGDAGTTGDAPHDPRCRVTVESHTVVCKEEWAFAAFTGREIDRACGARCERDRDHLASLAQNRERAVAAFESERFDVGADGFGDPQPVQCQQADERVITRRADTSGDEHGTNFVAIQPCRV
jgi:hypothetical protein